MSNKSKIVESQASFEKFMDRLVYAMAQVRCYRDVDPDTEKYMYWSKEERKLLEELHSEMINYTPQELVRMISLSVCDMSRERLSAIKIIISRSVMLLESMMKSPEQDANISQKR